MNKIKYLLLRRATQVIILALTLVQMPMVGICWLERLVHLCLWDLFL